MPQLPGNLERKQHIEPAFVDKRGEITNILEYGIEHVSLIASKKGSIRGNHYHKAEAQYLYLLEGRVRAYSEDVKTREHQVLIVERGDLLTTPAWVAHQHIALEDTTMIAMYTVPRLVAEQQDTFKFQLR